MKNKFSLRVDVLGAALLTAFMWVAPADSPVADAAARGELETVRALLKQGADVNAAQGDGMTALHWAAMTENVEMAKVLIYAGANLESTTRLGAYTPLHLAGRHGYAKVIETLLEAGSNATAVTTTGVSAIHLAAGSGQTDAVASLLRHGADINARELASGRTPLMFATALNRMQVIEFLLRQGADVSIATEVVDYGAWSRADGPERKRRAKLMAAAQDAESEARAAEEQLQSVADASAAQLQSKEEQQEEEQEKSDDEKDEAEQDEPQPQSLADSSAAELQSKAEDKEGKAEPRALSFGDLVGRQRGMTALHYAVRDGRLETVRLLLDAGADINRQTLGDQSSPLLVAAINGNYDLAMFLLEHDADPNLASEDGATPLYATLNNRWAPKALYPQPTAFKQQKTSYLELIEALLEKKADPNARLKTHLWYTSFNFDLLGVNFQGATPFWRAAHATDVSAMRLLIAHGADPNIPTTKPARRRRSGSQEKKEEEDQSGLPPVPIGGLAVYPIHAASGVGYGVARAGNSHRHAPDGWLPAVKYLVEDLGADVNARDHDGYAAVHHAAARGDNELIEYLVEQGADVTLMSRKGQTTVDMANGPQQRVQPFPETIKLLESLGAKNNHNCLSC